MPSLPTVLVRYVANEYALLAVALTLCRDTFAGELGQKGAKTSRTAAIMSTAVTMPLANRAILSNGTVTLLTTDY